MISEEVAVVLYKCRSKNVKNNNNKNVKLIRHLAKASNLHFFFFAVVEIPFNVESFRSVLFLPIVDILAGEPYRNPLFKIQKILEDTTVQEGKVQFSAVIPE